MNEIYLFLRFPLFFLYCFLIKNVFEIRNFSFCFIITDCIFVRRILTIKYMHFIRFIYDATNFFYSTQHEKNEILKKGEIFAKFRFSFITPVQIFYLVLSPPTSIIADGSGDSWSSAVRMRATQYGC